MIIRRLEAKDAQIAVDVVKLFASKDVPSEYLRSTGGKIPNGDDLMFTYEE